MSDDAKAADVQRFDRSGTWVKPPGAVRVEITLKGGDGESGGPGLRGGDGGGVSIAGAVGAAGGGGGAGTLTPAGAGTPGGKGETVTKSFAADELPDEVQVAIGQRGGYAVILSYG
jgi:hypothetical protein